MSTGGTGRGPGPLTALEARPRQPLARLPTPLAESLRLRHALGPSCPPLFLKLDAETGFALGGNKVRKLEHELAPPRLEGVTHVITSGGVQSNHARVTAAAASCLGLRCVLVVNGEATPPHRGNALLQRLFGAEVVPVPRREEREGAVLEAARRVEREGGRALVVPVGASGPTGALGYVQAAVELVRQLDGALAGEGDGRIRVFVPSSSCGTLAGLLAGFTLLERGDLGLVGVSVDLPAGEIARETRRIAAGTLEVLGAPGRPLPEGLLRVTDEEVGGGYGVPTRASGEALELFARSEGVVLDPVYTAKGAAGLVRSIRRGELEGARAAVFLHTGGHPALFA